MNRRDLLKMFGGLAVAPIALKTVLSNTTKTLPVQPLPIIENKTYHPKIDYMPLLRDMGGVTFSDWPRFYVNWDTMHVRYDSDITKTDKKIFRYSNVCVKTIKIKSLEWGLEFIKLNKKNVVVYDFFLQPWTELQNVCSDPGPFLRYVRKPEDYIVYPA